MSEWRGEGGKREERRGAIERVRESTTPVCEYRWKPQCTCGNQEKGCCWRYWAGFKEYSWERRYLILGLRSSLASGKAEVICQSLGENTDTGRGCSVGLLDRQ